MRLIDFCKPRFDDDDMSRIINETIDIVNESSLFVEMKRLAEVQCRNVSATHVTIFNDYTFAQLCSIIDEKCEGKNIVFRSFVLYAVRHNIIDFFDGFISKKLALIRMNAWKS